MAEAPERIWAMPARQLCWTEDNTNGVHVRGYYEYVRADLTPPADLITTMERALRPFAFFNEDNPDEDIQTAWETRYRDRFRDWIDFGDIEAVRAAIADLTAWRDGQRPPSEYEQKLAALKKDFPNGI